MLLSNVDSIYYLGIPVVIHFCILTLTVANEEASALTSCKDNEMYADCASGYCGPQRCADLGYPVPCPGGTAACHGGCVCIDGYVRDHNNTCIPTHDCSGCGGDKNATTGCGNHCGNTCADFKDGNKICLSGCRYNSCACKKGYVYLEKTSKCVMPIDCDK